MKKSGKSKDYKTKSDESKLKSTRKRRKSESSGSGSDHKKSYNEDTQKHDSCKDVEKDSDTVRSTRHSKRLIGSSDDNAKEEKSISLTIKMEKSSSKDSSPYRESKKKDLSSNENLKHKGKEVNVWKVKSSNGRGRGELQKLKICRQRTPEPIEMGVGCGDADKVETIYISTDEVSNDVSEVDVNDNNQKQSSVISDCSTDVNCCEVKELETKENKSEVNTALEQELSGSPPIDNCNTLHEKSSDEATELNDDKSITEKQTCVVDAPPISEEKVETNIVNENTNDNVDEVKNCDEENTSEISVSSKLDDPQVSPTITRKSEKCPDSEVFVKSSDSVPPSIKETACEVDNEVNDEEVLQISTVNDCSDNVVEAESLPEQKPVEDIITLHEEEYDYDENDDTEEGEISGSEPLSPVSQVYKKLPKEDQVRSWGTCGIFTFNKTSLVATEDVLKDYKIEKICSLQKDMMTIDSEDTDDLIFVKEIREENVIHEVDSETCKYLADESVIMSNEQNNETDDETRRDKSSGSNNNNNNSNKENRMNRKSSQNNSIAQTEELKITFNNENAIQGRDNIKITTENHKPPRESKRSARSPVKRIKESGKNSLKSQKGTEQDILCITNLVRPFTLSQLKELLQRTGKIVRDGFWIDSIKSKCYVQYETVDQAVETRHALNGIHWPVSNPKALSVRYATQDDMLKAQTQSDVTEIPRKTEPLVVHNHDRRIEWRTRKQNENSEDRPVKLHIGVREWDIGKPKNPDEMTFSDDQKNSLENERGKQKLIKRSYKNSPSPASEQPVKKPKKPEDRETKSLDDLFRRTKATPSLYWLPLTDEQIVEREALRRKQLEVIKQQRASKNLENESHSKRDERYYRNSKRR